MNHFNMIYSTLEGDSNHKTTQIGNFAFKMTIDLEKTTSKIRTHFLSIPYPNLSKTYHVSKVAMAFLWKLLNVFFHIYSKL